MELIKGRWYRCSNWIITIAVRYSRVNDDGKFLFDQEIARDSLFRKTDWLTFRTDFIEVPLSEIQQYLPEGHPDKEFVLPEKWCVKSTDNADETLIKWRGGNYCLRPAYLCCHKYWISADEAKDYTEITFEQFKKHVLKQNDMNKEIIGYKLKADCKQYEEAALKVMNVNWGESKYHVTASWCIRDLKKAGVLELWFEPVFKEKFKIGDWVMETWEHSPYFNKKAFRVNSVKNNTVKYNRNGECGCGVEYLRIATPEEIKKTLVEEAIKRGFTKGIKFKFKEQSYGKDVIEAEVYSLKAEYYENHGIGWRVIITSGGVVYSDKYEWAEILPNYPQIEINGYKGEFFDTYVKFGCDYINKSDILRLHQIMNGYFPGERDPDIIFKTIESVTIGKVTFTKKQIRQIAEYYLNKK